MKNDKKNIRLTDIFYSIINLIVLGTLAFIVVMNIIY